MTLIQKGRGRQRTARVRIVFTASSSTLPYDVLAEITMADIEKEDCLVLKIGCFTNKIGFWQDAVAE
jgi:hypothetical protein